MATTKSDLSPVELLRQRAGASERSQALDAELLKIVAASPGGDFDDMAARIGENVVLRDGLSSWLLSARTRGLLEQQPGTDHRQRFSVTPLGRTRLAAGG